MSVIFPSPFFNYNSSVLSEDESKKLSKQRIIQKNLVHFQGFPDRLYSKEILASEEYFGQYGLISKIILTNKMERKTNKRSNSAYITFYSYEQAAYAILSVDSIKIDDMLVRAFFGTTKYCNHFLNNFRCFNSEKCMFLHEIADPSDIITEDSKFGYSEHIKLAKKIIGFGSLQSQIYVRNNANKKKTALPTIATIYQKNDILMKTKNHRRKKSNDNKNLSVYNNNSNNTINDTQSSSNSFHSNSSNDINEINNENKDLSFNSLFNEEGGINNNLNTLFKSKKKSRFDFANNNKENDKNKKDKGNVPKIVQEIVDELSLRVSFFIPLNKYVPLKNLEIEFCNKLYNQTKNEELKNIIANLGHENFARIKMGVGEKPHHSDLVDYVLGHFRKEEMQLMEKASERVYEAVKMILLQDADAAMNCFNRKVD